MTSPDPVDERERFPWLTILASVGFCVLSVPVVGAFIRAMEPGRAPTTGRIVYSASANGPEAIIHCSEPCRIRSHLKLLAGGAQEDGVIVAWSDAPGTEPIVHFPTPGGTRPAVPVSKHSVVLSEGIALDAQFERARQWTVHVRLVASSSPVLSPLSPEFLSVPVLASSDTTLSLGEGSR